MTNDCGKPAFLRNCVNLVASRRVAFLQLELERIVAGLMLGQRGASDRQVNV